MWYNVFIMKFQTLAKQIFHKDCPIAIRRIGENFEYITCINNEIYSSYVTAKKSPLQKILFLPYTEKQLRNITNYIISMAQTTIDTVLSPEPKAKHNK